MIHTEAPYYFRRADTDMSEAQFVQHCVDELEALIEREGADTIAAFIGEPVLGTGGIVPPPAGYWEAIQAVLERTTSCWSPTRWSPVSGGWARCSGPIITG